jgi:exonuclease SbcD
MSLRRVARPAPTSPGTPGLLCDVLARIADLARDEGADALFCAGDLYEHDRFAPDTGNVLRSVFANLHPMRVFLAPGNHDWCGPASLYERVEWSPNVHVFKEDRLQPVELTDGVTLWGAAHRAPANTDGFLEGFSPHRSGIHLALFHGSESGWLKEQGEGKVPHAPFDAEQLERSGLHHAFVGHYHRPCDGHLHTYPGNPEPLGFGEDGERGAVIATIAADGSVSRQRRRVSISEMHDVQVDVTGCSSLQDVRNAVASVLHDRAGSGRVTLRGEIDLDIDLRPADMSDAAPGLDILLVARIFRYLTQFINRESLHYIRVLTHVTFVPFSPRPRLRRFFLLEPPEKNVTHPNFF